MTITMDLRSSFTSTWESAPAGGIAHCWLPTSSCSKIPPGETFSGYVEGSAFGKDGINLQLAGLNCRGQNVPVPWTAPVHIDLDTSRTRHPFTLSLSAAQGSSAHHVEYWVNCKADAPLRFPLSHSLYPVITDKLDVIVEPQSAPCAEHAFKITVNAAEHLPPGNYEEILTVHAPGGGTSSGEELRFQWRENEAPEVFGVNPSHGIGPEALFHVAVADRNGDFERVDLLINDGLREQGGCCISYFVHAPGSSDDPRGLVLHADTGRDVVSKLVGQAGIENERCSIKSGWEQLLRDVAIHFKPAFRGPKKIYVRAIDSIGASSGWMQAGTWTASDEEPPEPIAVKPYLGSGARQTFDFSFSDINGGDDIVSAEISIQFGRDEAGACRITFDRNAGAIQLGADTGAPGTLRVDSQGGAVRNRQCAVSDVAVTTDSRDTIHLAMTIEFGGSFKGRRNIYARARDKAGESSPWRWLGSWVVPER